MLPSLLPLSNALRSKSSLLSTVAVYWNSLTTLLWCLATPERHMDILPRLVKSSTMPKTTLETGDPSLNHSLLPSRAGPQPWEERARSHCKLKRDCLLFSLRLPRWNPRHLPRSKGVLSPPFTLRSLAKSTIQNILKGASPHILGMRLFPSAVFVCLSKWESYLLL
jgi:hypothetical protein